MKSDTNLLVQGGDTVSLTWNPAHLLSFAPANSFTVNVVMYLLLDPQDDGPSHWTNTTTLLSDVSNLGTASLEVPANPLLPLTDPQEQSPYALLMFKLVFIPLLSSSNKYVAGLSSIDFYDTSEAAGLWSNVMFRTVREDEGYCSGWSSIEGGGSFVPFVAGDCDGCVSSCPCNMLQASTPNSGFVSLATSEGSTVLGQFLHPQASACYASMETRYSNLLLFILIMFSLYCDCDQIFND